MKEALARMLEQHGVTLPAERAEALARSIAAQLEAERAATRALRFEDEPSAFFAELEKGPR